MTTGRRNSRNRITKEIREQILYAYLGDPIKGTELAMSNGLTAAYAYKLANERAGYCRRMMRSCLGAAIQRDWHQHDCPHSRDKGNALRPSEPSVVRERPNAAQAGGSCCSVIRRVPGMSGGPPPQRIFAHA